MSVVLGVLFLGSIVPDALRADAWSDRMDRARSAAARRQFGQAVASCREALKLVEGEGPAGARLAVTLNELAIALSEANENAEAARVLERVLPMLEANLGKEHQAVGRAVSNLAQARRKSGQGEAALPLFERAIAIGRKTLSPQDPELARRLMGGAIIHHAAGRLDSARPLYDEALKLLDRPGDGTRLELAVCLGKRAELLLAKNDPVEAAKDAERGVKEAIAAGGPASKEALFLTGGLASVHRATGRADREAGCWRTLVEAIDAGRPVDEQALLVPLHQLANVYWRLGNAAEVGPVIRRSHALRVKLFGQDHPAVALAEEESGALAEVEGRKDQARRHYESAVAIWNRIGVEDARAIHALLDFGDFLAVSGETREGKVLIKRAFEATRATLGPDCLKLAEIMDRLGTVLERAGDRQRALKAHERALERWKKGLGEGHPRVAVRTAELGRLYLAVGAVDRAQKLNDEALGVLRSTVGTNHADTARALEGQAQVYRALGYLDHAQMMESEVAIIRARLARPAGDGRSKRN
ncbi:MAG: tetratricopeptide repeat protein [Candidatus Riflebacteria bacterium]|nr:tetratricopeptide repeat protein [Candidatus Riflebacteria bacterium]